MCFTESKGRFDTMSRPDFKSFSAICKSRGQFPNHVTALISEQFLESGSDDLSSAKLGKRILLKAKAVLCYIKWYCMVLYGLVWYCMVLCFSVGHCIVLHSIVWYCQVLYGISLWYLHSTVLYCIVLYCIA